MLNIIGQRVKWIKLTSKPNASMQETEGFGVLFLLEIDQRMGISGDYGVSTSAVKSYEVSEEGVKVTTQNSVYLINEIK